VADFSVDTGDLGALGQAFAAAASDARGIAASFRSGAGRLTSGDSLGRPDVVAQYAQAFDQWTHNLDEIASSMEKLSHALGLARNLYEIAERNATVGSGR
jgi:methyl-accepting chemotaxis protein